MSTDRRLFGLLQEMRERFNGKTVNAGEADPRVMLSGVAANVAAALEMPLEAARPLLMESLLDLMAMTILADNGIEARRLVNQRRFVILGDDLIVAPESDDRGHHQWMQDEEMAAHFDSCIRGHIDDVGLFLYKGIDCRQLGDAEVWEIRGQLKRLAEELNLVADTTVYCGLLPARYGSRPSGRVRLGWISEILQ